VKTRSDTLERVGTPKRYVITVFVIRGSQVQILQSAPSKMPENKP